jgi:NAD dependent epimerase/dehydratase family enzyme
VLPVPAFVLKTALGELSGLLLGSLRGHPRRLLDSGFHFDHPGISEILRSALQG